MIRSVLLAFGLVLFTAGHTVAEQVSFRYLPNAAGTTSLYRGTDGAVGEQRVWWGGAARPFHQQFAPTHTVTFRHPYTGQDVPVPMTFPEGTPRIDHRTDRIIFNYGSYTVSSVFHPDGSVEVIYNSGLFRPLRVR